MTKEQRENIFQAPEAWGSVIAYEIILSAFREGILDPQKIHHAEQRYASYVHEMDKAMEAILDTSPDDITSDPGAYEVFKLPEYWDKYKDLKNKYQKETDAGCRDQIKRAIADTIVYVTDAMEMLKDTGEAIDRLN